MHFHSCFSTMIKSEYAKVLGLQCAAASSLAGIVFIFVIELAVHACTLHVCTPAPRVGISRSGAYGWRSVGRLVRRKA
jgi:hypothetical protein